MIHEVASQASCVTTLVVRGEERSGVLTVWASREDIPRYWGEMKSRQSARVIGPAYSIDTLEAEARQLL